MYRRIALLGIGLVSCWTCWAIFAADQTPLADARPASQAASQKISTLYLFVHCLGSWDSPEVQREYTAKWKTLIEKAGTQEENAICFLTSGPESIPVADLARSAFGDRCIVDPYDNGPATKALVADDVSAACNQRGMISEWTPYEMWTSINARRWTEGLKNELRRRRLTYDPQQLRIVAVGQQWGGCLTKYSNFMARYLDLARPAEVRPELSPYAGYPLKARFRESLPLDRHVQLYLFETADGRPMAQFLDGLRAVYEPPHVAVVSLDSVQVDVIAVPPSENMQVQQVTNPVVTGSIMVDVGDGCRPVITTIVGKNISYDDFRAALAKATIAPFARKHASKTRFVPMGCSELLCPVKMPPESATTP